MYRAIPQSNKILSKKWQQREQRMHRQKLKSIKSCVDFRQPKSLSVVSKKSTRSKHAQLLEGKPSDPADRYTEIERENKILL
jgi:hypothetical protein